MSLAREKVDQNDHVTDMLTMFGRNALIFMDPLQFTDELSKYLTALFQHKLHAGLNEPRISLGSPPQVLPPITIPLPLVNDCERVADSLVTAYRSPCEQSPICVISADITLQTDCPGMWSDMPIG